MRRLATLLVSLGSHRTREVNRYRLLGCLTLKVARAPDAAIRAMAGARFLCAARIADGLVVTSA